MDEEHGLDDGLNAQATTALTPDRANRPDVDPAILSRFPSHLLPPFHLWGRGACDSVRWCCFFLFAFVSFARFAVEELRTAPRSFAWTTPSYILKGKLPVEQTRAPIALAGVQCPEVQHRTSISAQLLDFLGFTPVDVRIPPSGAPPITHRMVENKRQSSSAKASQGSSASASGPGMTTAMVPLEAALSGAIGAR